MLKMNNNSIRNISLAVAAVFLLGGCGLFKKYTDDKQAPEGLFGSDSIVEESLGGSSIGDIPWSEFFTDPLLRDLIDSALARNNDMKVARLTLQQAEEALTATKLNFLPSLYFSPYISYDANSSYTLPFSLDWNTPGFGSLTNRKREADALARQAADNEQAVRSGIVAQVAKGYYQLQMLDRQLAIMTETERIWADVLETQRALMENGKAYSTSVNQMESSLMGIKINRVDLREQVKNAEYAICLLLAQVPHTIDRSAWDTCRISKRIDSGVPVALLDKRPDVRAARRNVEAAYYVSKQALAAMFPSVTLSGLLGWSNGGVAISDPLKLIYNVLGELSQPIFARGQLQAKYKISKLQQEAVADVYAQTILRAGNEVNCSLRNCQMSAEKFMLYKRQVEKLRETWTGTIELMKNGKATYVEVLMAQDALLQAEIGEIANMYQGRQSMIELYIALGGGV